MNINPLIPIVAFTLPCSFFIYIFLKQRKNLQKYLIRPCAGREWNKAFPESSKHEIRRFITLFIDVFLFKPNQRLKFLPSDKVMDIYRSFYFDRGLPDTMELEIFMQLIEKEYNIDIFNKWNEEIALGDIFSLIRKKNIKNEY